MILPSVNGLNLAKDEPLATLIDAGLVIASSLEPSAGVLGLPLCHIEHDGMHSLLRF
jgi:hypothetical protein